MLCLGCSDKTESKYPYQRMKVKHVACRSFTGLVRSSPKYWPDVPGHLIEYPLAARSKEYTVHFMGK